VAACVVLGLIAVTSARSGRPSRAALTPAALAERLGLAEWQVLRAARDGLIPGRDRSRGWSADLADKIAATVEGRREELLAEIGRVPDMATWDTADYLARRFGFLEVGPALRDGVRELAHLGVLKIRWWDREYPIFDGRTIEAITDVEVVRSAMETGRTLTSDQAAERLRIRRVDFDHAVRAGLIRARRRVPTGYASKRYDPGMLLFRTAAVDELAALPEPGGVSWETVRGLKPGQRSPWAKLPDAPRGGSS
jgi:hypothetical protein